MRTTQERTRRNAIRGARYVLENLDCTNKPGAIDAKTKAEYARAAKILIDRYHESEVARNMPEVVKGYIDSKTTYQFISHNEIGRPVLDSKPPPDWPLSDIEWSRSIANPPYSLLDCAIGYTMYEKERLSRQYTALHNYGVNALDPKQVKRLYKSRDKAQSIVRRNWRERERERLAGGPDAIPGLTYGSNVVTPYVSSSDPYADAAMDMMDTPLEVSPMWDEGV